MGAKAELYRLIDGLCREGLAVIVTSSELPELLTLSDRILVLCEGRVTGHFTRLPKRQNTASWKPPPRRAQVVPI